VGIAFLQNIQPNNMMDSRINVRSADNPYVISAYVLAAVTAATLAIWFVSNTLTQGAGFLLDPQAWLNQFSNEVANEILSNSAEVVAAVLAIAITVVAIVVELAATRYSHLITRLFFREPVNALVLGLLVVTTIQCLLAPVSSSSLQPLVVPQAGSSVTLVLVIVSLLVLLPYIYFVFAMLSPISIIDRICKEAFRSITRARSKSAKTGQSAVLRSIEELQDISRGAISQGDRDIAMACVQGLTALVYKYTEIKPRLPDAWFDLSGPISGDADFIALGSDSLRVIEHRRSWLETKVFRQLVAMVGQSSGVVRDVANLIAINTRHVATDLGVQDETLLNLCMRAFNSYLRATLNAGDPRTMYYIMNQYRIVGDALLSNGQRGAAIEVAGYLREYGQLAHKSGLSFLLESASYDVMQLIEQALEVDDEAVDDLLSVLLELDQDIKDESHEASLLGVRRSQIQVGALLLMGGHQARVTRVVDDLLSEQLERLERLRAGMETDNRNEYWELIDRGGNFGYMPVERRPYLKQLFSELRRRDSTSGTA
jgi:hypothetical protein